MKVTKRVFRILKNVKITYSKSTRYDGFCSITPSVKKATVYPCPDDVDPDMYRFHELLHIALRKLDTLSYDEKDDAEEILIQDIVSLIRGV